MGDMRRTSLIKSAGSSSFFLTRWCGWTELRYWEFILMWMAQRRRSAMSEKQRERNEPEAKDSRIVGRQCDGCAKLNNIEFVVTR
jgi:hypothetical protein